ncbi:MAG TPA: GtrA family protein [Candidatus Paceibacterota bacterium]|nr:GtrA family protein [Candidatus Paceibacterota bacterium]
MSFIRKFTRRDLVFAIGTGLITGVIASRIFIFLGTPEFFGFPWSGLIVLVPILWILGVLLGYFLGQWFKFFEQFGRFAAIGFTNASVDFGVLNLEIALSGLAFGPTYPFFKAISFICATCSSYVWNKYWTFNAGRSRGGFKEFGKFFATAIVAFIVNVAVASSVVNFIHPILGVNAHVWANLSAVAGSAAGLVFSFVGFKKAVFKA